MKLYDIVAKGCIRGAIWALGFLYGCIRGVILSVKGLLGVHRSSFIRPKHNS